MSAVWIVGRDFFALGRLVQKEHQNAGNQQLHLKEYL
jgi:hypothetical protein